MSVFHTSVNWWFSSEVWVTTSLFKSPELFLVFWPISLNGRHSSTYFQVHQSLYQCFSDCTEPANYKWYLRHFHVPYFFFSFLARSMYLSSLQFYRVVSRDAKVHYSVSSLFLLLTFFKFCRLAEIRWSVSFYPSIYHYFWNSHGVMVKELGFGLNVSEFEF